MHKRIFAIDDPESVVEIVGWRARVNCALRHDAPTVAEQKSSKSETASRQVYLHNIGLVDTPVYQIEDLQVGHEVAGPTIIESAISTVVVDERSAVTKTESGSLLLTINE